MTCPTVLTSSNSPSGPLQLPHDRPRSLRFLELQPTSHRCGLPAEQPTHRAADATGVALLELDLGRHHEIRCDHLAAAHVRPLPRLACLRELPLLHQVLHAGASLDDDELVGLRAETHPARIRAPEGEHARMSGADHSILQKTISS
jgi:hypothetical protein